MFLKLLVLFTIIPVVELFFLIRIGSLIGALPTIFIVLFTGIAGAALARSQGFQIIQKIQHSLALGKAPTREMIEGVLIFAGGLLLLTPGFITDITGFLMIFPFSRQTIVSIAIQSLGPHIHTCRPQDNYHHHNDDDDVVLTIEKNSDK